MSNSLLSAPASFSILHNTLFRWFGENVLIYYFFSIGKVHSGAPPHWLNASEGNHLDGRLKSGLGLKSRKSSRLNPKRVGVAWVDRRKIDLEMEKRGEIVSNNFEVDSQKSPKIESHSKMPMQLQPYLSKRMRRDDGKL